MEIVKKKILLENYELQQRSDDNVTNGKVNSTSDFDCNENNWQHNEHNGVIYCYVLIMEE